MERRSVQIRGSTGGQGPRKEGTRSLPAGARRAHRSYSRSGIATGGRVARSPALRRAPRLGGDRGKEIPGMKVAVLMGGNSSEREISLRTGRGIAQALRNTGHDVVAVDAANGKLLPAGEEERAALPSSALEPTGEAVLARPETLGNAEVVFVALHGSAGENGTLQALLDLTGRPYTGSGLLASALAMDKAMSKRVFEREQIPTPRWLLVETDGLDASMLRTSGALPP